VLDYLADLESDFSAIHGLRIDPWAGEWAGLSGPKFFRMAQRLAAYRGVIRARLLAEDEREQRRNDGAVVIPLSAAMVAPDGTIAVG
jgi:hypothetical protein